MKNMVYGRNAVIMTLESGRTVNKLLFSESVRKNPKIDLVIKLAKQRRIPFKFVPQRRVDELSGVTSHQGILAFVSPVEYATVDDMIQLARERNEPPLIILLDSIEDPHNLGAIIRTAVAAGAHGVVIPKHQAAAVSDTVEKVSAGAAERCLIARVSNLVQIQKELKQAGVWLYGADHHAEKAYYEEKWQGPVGIVMGNEGNGIRQLVRENCDFLVSIPMSGEMESLNVSVSAGILLFKIREMRSV